MRKSYKRVAAAAAAVFMAVSMVGCSSKTSGEQVQETTQEKEQGEESEKELKVLTLKKENVNYYVSPITSGDCFVTDSKVRDEIYNRTKATIVDMESASIGHISRKNNVPFVCIRTVSDFADGNDDFEKEAGERSTEIVKKIIENL